MLKIFRISGDFIKKCSNFYPVSKNNPAIGVLCVNGGWVNVKHVTGDFRQSFTIMTITVNVPLFLTAIHIYNKSAVTKNLRNFILAD